jgi:hypothetical protein
LGFRKERSACRDDKGGWGFVEKAPKELIEGEKAKREEAMAKLEKLKKLV